MFAVNLHASNGNLCSLENDSGTPLQSTSGQPTAKWCSTELGKVRMNFLWIIKSLPDYTTFPGDALHSSQFTADGKAWWQLVLYPKGLTETDSEFVSLYLDLVNASEVDPLDVRYEITLSSNTGCKIRSRLFQKKFGPGGEKRWGQRQFANRAEVMSRITQDGVLRVTCDLTVLGEPITSGYGCLPPDDSQPRREMKSDIAALFTEPMLTDFVLIADGERFEVHRAILCARSQVFKAMLMHNTKEATEGQVVIEDVSAATVREMLKFLYTDNTDALETMALDLLIVSDRYDLPGLKYDCEQALLSQLSFENAFDLLILSDSYNASTLRANCVDLLKASLNKVLTMAQWESLVKSHTHLASEILQKYTAATTGAKSALSP